MQRGAHPPRGADRGPVGGQLAARQDRDQRRRPQLGAYHDGTGQDRRRGWPRTASPSRSATSCWWRRGCSRPGARLDRIHEVMGGPSYTDRHRPRAGPGRGPGVDIGSQRGVRSNQREVHDLTRTVPSFGLRRPRRLAGKCRAPLRGPAARDRRPTERRRKGRQHHGNTDHEGAAGGRGALRPPDQALEPEDAEVHLRRAQRHLHHRPAEDPQEVPRGLRVRARPRRRRGHRAVRGHQEAGAGDGARGGHPLRACSTSTTAGSAAPSPTSRRSGSPSPGSRSSTR